MERKIYRQVNDENLEYYYSNIEDFITILKDEISHIDIRKNDLTMNNKPLLKLSQEDREFLEKNIESFINQSEDFMFVENSELVKKMNGKPRKPQIKNGNIVNPPAFKFKYHFRLVMRNNEVTYSFDLTDYEKIFKRIINLKKIGI